MGSDVPTILGTSECTTENKGDQGVTALAALPVRPVVTAEVIHINFHSSETLRTAASPTLIRDT